MIESITITGVATYDKTTPESLKDLSKINFLYGSNGTGKTTISRIVADETGFPTCKVDWVNGVKIKTLVYNRDFVSKNFDQSPALKGVFTLGEGNIDAINKINSAKQKLEEVENDIASRTKTLQGDDGNGGKKGELNLLEEKFKESCWTAYTKHKASKISEAFEGFRDKKEKFKNKILTENTSNSAVLKNLSDLEKTAESIFGTNPVIENLLPIIEEEITKHESNPILKKKVIGKDDVDIAAMIKKLGSSDWVREGKSFYENSEGKCPFCQQSVNESFSKSLNEYFDEAFEVDNKAIDDLNTNYKTDSARFQQTLASLLASPSKFLNAEKLKTEKELLDLIISNNTQKLILKKKEPSQSLELESASNVLKEIEKLISETNAAISKHNETVNNLANERTALKSQIWKYLIEQWLRSELDSYIKEKTDLDKAVSSIEEQIKNKKKEAAEKSAEIHKLEKDVTSIQPTIDEINRLLKSFGFHSFALGKAEDNIHYKLIRPDGIDAKETLSEGEKTFVTFLYFYHLLQGSESSTGISENRVVVFDDPVSSLDSDILFVVSNLIKEIFTKIKNKEGYIKQVFVMTHNVYFHKEVSFCRYNYKSDKSSLKEATFWIVRKMDSISKLEKYDTNPISTSYNLLWAEVRKVPKGSLTIQNTLRRILENYFKILGGHDFDALCSKFEGNDKVICQSLTSWVQDGSHYANDDLYISITDTTIEVYLRVFKEIFEKTGHLNHYKMMMGSDYIEHSSLTN
ncbi:MAG: AAA family ATPase [Proteobacteria bacterium]|nr:AAA family ATPase [Pseudomonadota bacterium]NCA27659.1 AAA family ATPase [Pseudomonadota bacterium]